MCRMFGCRRLVVAGSIGRFPRRFVVEIPWWRPAVTCYGDRGRGAGRSTGILDGDFPALRPMLPGLVPIGRSAPVLRGSGSDLRGDGGPGERWLDPRRSGLERRGVIGKDRGMIELATPRLVLRGWREDDLNALAAVNADPEVMRFIGDGSVRDREQTAAGLAVMEREWAERGFGIF